MGNLLQRVNSEEPLALEWPFLLVDFVNMLDWSLLLPLNFFDRDGVLPKNIL
jgi:hypothetical protein